jgi:hypothetical protein
VDGLGTLFLVMSGGAAEGGSEDLQGSQRFKYNQQPIEQTRLIRRSLPTPRSLILLLFLFFGFSVLKRRRERKSERARITFG